MLSLPPESPTLSLVSGIFVSAFSLVTLFFLAWFWVTPGEGQGLFLARLSGVIPGKAQGMMWDAQHWGCGKEVPSLPSYRSGTTTGTALNPAKAVTSHFLQPDKLGLEKQSCFPSVNRSCWWWGGVHPPVCREPCGARDETWVSPRQALPPVL